MRIAGVDRLLALDDPVEDRDPGGPGQFLQFVQGVLGLSRRLGGYRDENAPLRGAVHLPRLLPGLLERCFERGDECAEIQGEGAERLGSLHQVRLGGPGGGGDEVGDLDVEPLPVERGEERGDEVEPEERQVGQVVAGERLAPEMGMDEAQPPEELAAEGKVGEFRDEEAPLVADDDVLHGAGAADEDPDLAAGLLGEFGHPPGQFVADDLLHRDAAAVEPFQPVDLAFLETGQVAVELTNIGTPEMVVRMRAEG